MKPEKPSGLGTYVCRACNGYGAMRYRGLCFRCFTLKNNPVCRAAQKKGKGRR